MDSWFWLETNWYEENWDDHDVEMNDDFGSDTESYHHNYSLNSWSSDDNLDNQYHKAGKYMF